MTSKVDKIELADALSADRERIERRLNTLLDELAGGEGIIEEAVRYMVLDAGKRLRPVLCLWTHDALEGKKRDACLDVACALECLHTYSLIHDDLPCMDDDDMRRGRPSCHKKYGDAMAVLAGDALLTLCFDIAASLGERWEVSENAVVQTTRIISRAGGTLGLIGGQVLDISSDDIKHSREMVEMIHQRKTAALIAASMESGAVVAGTSDAEREKVRHTGFYTGRAFQIVDDVLDVETEGDALGKTPGKDLRDGKLTFPSLVGVEASREEAVRLTEEAKTEMAGWPKAGLLIALLDLMVERRA